MPTAVSTRLLAIFAGALLLASGTAPAQVATLKFDRFTSEHGLSDNYVLCIAQDRRGFMWFGTRDGLNRYDGYSFVTFRHRPGDPTSLPDGSIKCLYEDRLGRLWIGTHSGGLALMDNVTGRFRRYQHDPADPRSIGTGHIAAIAEDRAGNLWVATANRGAGISVLEAGGERFTRFTYSPGDPHSLSSNNVVGLCRDSAGTIWIATADSGLNRFDPSLGGFVNHRTAPALAVAREENLSAITCERDGAIVILTASGVRPLETGPTFLSSPTAYRTPTYRATTYRATTSQAVSSRPAGLSPLPTLARPSAVMLDRSGRRWTTSFTDGVVVAGPGTLGGGHLHARHAPANAGSIPSNTVFCVVEDRAGNVWLGTERGICRLHRRAWQFGFLQHDPFDGATIASPVVRSLAVDSRGTLWMGTAGGGLDRLRSGAASVDHERFPDPTGATNTVNAIMFDRRGAAWIGTNHGLVRIAGGRRTVWRHRPNDPGSIAPGGVWAVIEDAGSIWVGSLYGGISVLDAGSRGFRHIRHDPADSTSLSSNDVLTLCRTRDGSIWAGTDNGLNRFDRAAGRWRRYSHDPKDSTTLSNDRVWYIHEARDGALWIATSGGGVNRMDPATGRCRRIMESDGLAANTAAAIMEDSSGRIWAGTANGLSCIGPNAIRNYRSADGLPVYEYHFKSCCMDSTGRMYFGGVGGVVSFRPEDLADNPRPPATVITSFRTLDTSFRADSVLAGAGRIVLDHDHNSFALQFAALDFSNPGGNTYRYMLEGYDRTPREAAASARFAEYTNVPPGTYRFVVSGANSDGVRDSTGHALLIEIRPAYWQTWWFAALCAALLCAGIALALVARVRSVRGRERAERRVLEYQLQALRAQMNPHFLFNALNSILSFVVRRDVESAQQYLTAFSSLVRNTLESVHRDSVSLADELDSLRLYLTLESLRFGDRFDVAIDVADDVDPHQTEIPPMIIQPYVENALRHGLAHRPDGGRIEVRISRAGDALVCSIADNGVGRAESIAIQKGELRRHRLHGMSLTANRLEALGRLHRQRYHVEVTDLHDADGTATGTRVDLSIPCNHAARAEAFPNANR